MEIFKKIEGYDYLEVSNYGNVRSVDHITIQNNKGTMTETHYKGKVYKQFQTNSGYLQVHFKCQGKHYNLLVHRLVAQAFIPNPNNLPCVNHKDGNKENNVVENLEWISYSDNLKHAYNNKLIEPNITKSQKEQVKEWNKKGIEHNKTLSKPILCLNNNQIYENTRDCCKQLNIDRGTLLYLLHNKPKINKHINKDGSISYYYNYITNVKGLTFKYL